MEKPLGNKAKSARYALIAGLCRKKHRTVKTYFLRAKMDVSLDSDVEAYLDKHYFRFK